MDYNDQVVYIYIALVVNFARVCAQQEICGVKAKNSWTSITVTELIHPNDPTRLWYKNISISCHDQQNHLEMVGKKWFMCNQNQTLDRDKEAESYCEPTCSPIPENIIAVTYQSAPIVNGENNGRYMRGTRATYFCKNITDHLRGPSETVCQDDETFSPPPPTCVATCKADKLVDELGGRLNSTVGIQFLDPPQRSGYPNYYSRAILNCTDEQSHHQLIGEKEIRCLKNGSWEDHDQLKCGELFADDLKVEDTLIPLTGIVLVFVFASLGLLILISLLIYRKRKKIISLNEPSLVNNQEGSQLVSMSREKRELL